MKTVEPTELQKMARSVVTRVNGENHLRLQLHPSTVEPQCMAGTIWITCSTAKELTGLLYSLRKTLLNRCKEYRMHTTTAYVACTLTESTLELRPATIEDMGVMCGRLLPVLSRIPNLKVNIHEPWESHDSRYSQWTPARTVERT